MGDDNDRSATTRLVVHGFDDDIRRGRIKVPCGLICEQHSWVTDEGSAECDALRLSARYLPGLGVASKSYSHLLYQSFRA